LPLTTDEFSFAHNWLTSAQQLCERGDRHAACYQVDQVAKKLML
jgi:HEPN domain-containing protein